MKTKEISEKVIIANLEKKANPLLKQAKPFQLAIDTQEEYDNGAAIIKQLKALSKDAKGEEALITNPIKEGLERIKTFFSPFYKKVEAAEIEVKQRMLDFENKKEEEQKKLLAKFDKGKIKKVSTLTAKLEETRVKSNTSSKTRTLMKASIIDEKKIPREYLIVDMKAVEKALKEGIKVPGAELIEVKSIAI